jgi:hypothetical protein
LRLQRFRRRLPPVPSLRLHKDQINADLLAFFKA